MQFNAGQINTFGPRDKFFSVFAEETTSLLGSAEVGAFKDFVPRFTYRDKWYAHMTGGNGVFVPGSNTGDVSIMPGIRVYGDLYQGATDGNVIEWRPMSVSETHAEGEFILPQGGSALAGSFIGMSGIDNIDIYLNMIGERMAPIEGEAEPWE